MKNFKKYFGVAVILIVFVGMIPSVLHAVKENKERSSGFGEETTVEQTADNTDSTPTETDTTTENNTENNTDETPTEPALPETVEPNPPIQLGDLPARAGEHGIFVTGDASYFDDALFVGDSRTLDLCEFGTLQNADFYSASGMSVFNIKERKSTDRASDLLFADYIKQKTYGKVYIMLGFNECGYVKSGVVKKYQELIDMIRAAQPNAIIYIQANLVVTAHCSATDKYSHNPDIIEMNNLEAKLANGKDILYIDVNTQFCLSDGTLDPSKTGDGQHVYAKCVAEWCEWLKTRIAKTE